MGFSKPGKCATNIKRSLNTSRDATDTDEGMRVRNVGGRSPSPNPCAHCLMTCTCIRLEFLGLSRSTRQLRWYVHLREVVETPLLNVSSGSLLLVSLIYARVRSTSSFRGLACSGATTGDREEFTPTHCREPCRRYPHPRRWLWTGGYVGCPRRAVATSHTY